MQQGGSPYRAPPPSSSQQQAELTPFSAPPISTRPPPSATATPATPAVPNYEELGSMGDDVLGSAGDEGGSGSLSGNRWPRQETLALLKIRSDMDAAFRDATLKGPLWEEVSRKLAELGYKRNAKKCKEKFENVHKYYKRTKEGRAGRQDGKSYRFFTQLEALQKTTGAAAADQLLPVVSAPAPVGSVISSQVPFTMSIPPSQNPPRIQQISAPIPIATAPPAASPQQPLLPPQAVVEASEHPTGSVVAAAAGAAGISFSSNTSSSASESDDEATEEGPSRESGEKKRKREEGGSSGGGGSSRKMMAFFEGLMRQVMERQEAMQQRFLEAIEKREQERMIREEAWRRQEASRTAREHELAAQERTAAASRDATIISFLQKIKGQTVQIPSTAAAAAPAIHTPPPVTPLSAPSQFHYRHQQQHTATPPPPQQPVVQPPPQQQQPVVQQPPQQQNTEIVVHHPPPPASTEMVPMGSTGGTQEGGAIVSMSMDPASSSRWPKSEVHALIQLRSGLDPRYQESGPKGPLWEEISAGMTRLGYKRSAKRCKEKWENINKYFKKVKESNKKRPEDAKTCPYFHQLDALYRSKQIGGRHQDHDAHSNPNPAPAPISMMPPAPPPSNQQQQTQQQHQGEMDNKSNGGGGPGPSNGGMADSFFGEPGTGDTGIMKKPEDIVKELMGQSNHSEYGGGRLGDSDEMDEDIEDDDDEDEDDDDQFRIQFQRQNVGPNAAAAGGNGGGGAAAAAANSASGSGKPSSGSFLAMVR